jgi:hypothetical protein
MTLTISIISVKPITYSIQAKILRNHTMMFLTIYYSIQVESNN